ncbi:MAG: hypothetical protein FH749_14040 [Firmicutes bacterium]|nr:hypothetical protein [Bacillota bacterium]
MKQLNCPVPVLAVFEQGKVRPLAFKYQGRRWSVTQVIRDWQQFALLEEKIHTFVVETETRLAQLSYYPQTGRWHLDKL